MSKRVLSILICAALILSLGACGGGQNDGPEPPESTGGSQQTPSGEQPPKPSASDAPTEDHDVTEPPESDTPETEAPETEPTSPPEEITWEQRDFFDLFLGFMGELLMIHADNMEVNDELIDSRWEFDLDDSTSVVLQMWKKYYPVFAEKFDAMGDNAKQEAFGVNADNLSELFSVDWKDLYAEYETLRSEFENTNIPMEDVLTALSFSDGVMCDERGVKVTFKGFRLEDNGTLFMNFDVSNQNEDNKKLFIDKMYVAVNGLVCGTYGGMYVTLTPPEGMEVGTDSAVALPISGSTIMEEIYALGETTSSFPIETVSFWFSLKIGSNSEQESRVVTLKSSAYQDGSFVKYLGDMAGSATSGGMSYDIYVKRGDFGMIVTGVATSDVPEPVNPAFPDTTLNGNNVFLYEGSFARSNFVWANTCVVLLQITKTEEELRKENEIGNSEPFEIALKFMEGDTVVIYSK